jgi:hypothetical protein
LDFRLQLQLNLFAVFVICLLLPVACGNHRVEEAVHIKEVSLFYEKFKKILLPTMQPQRKMSNSSVDCGCTKSFSDLSVELAPSNTE